VAEVNNIEIIVNPATQFLYLDDWKSYYWPTPLTTEYLKCEIQFAKDGTGLEYDTSNGSGGNNKWWIDTDNISDPGFSTPSTLGTVRDSDTSTGRTDSNGDAIAADLIDGGSIAPLNAPSGLVGKLVEGVSRFSTYQSKTIHRRFPVKYRDTSGVIRNYVATQEVLMKRVRPPSGWFTIYLHMDFSGIGSSTAAGNMGIRSGTGRTDATKAYIVPQRNDYSPGDSGSGASGESFGQYHRGPLYPVWPSESDNYLVHQWLRCGHGGEPAENNEDSSEVGRYENFSPITTDEQVDKAYAFFPQFDFRLTGNARGTVSFDDLTWNDDSSDISDLAARREAIMGIDLFATSVFSTGTGSSREFRYRGSIGFDSRVNSSLWDGENGAEENEECFIDKPFEIPFYPQIGGTGYTTNISCGIYRVQYQQDGDDAFSQFTVPSHNNTTARMYFPEGWAVIPCLYLERSSATGGTVPSGGKVVARIDLEYYRVDDQRFVKNPPWKDANVIKVE
ncbi:MAG: hypothetical protein VXZ58_04855, partial [Actinomycetota bacterium]|nr:hypothetical protein [Actinomycetota bacterium]